MPARASFLSWKGHDVSGTCKYIVEMKIKFRFGNIFTFPQTSRSLKDHICTLYAANKKEAVMSHCLDRKEV